MLLSKIYKKLVLLSPWIEIILRHIYWKNVKTLKHFSPYKKTALQTDLPPINFDDILTYLRSKGVGAGSLIIVHSSYDTLKRTGLKPDEIIRKLLDVVGETGTLAMPAIRHFKEEPDVEHLLTSSMEGVVCEYNVMRTPIVSGILPFTLLRTNGSVCSHFPFNPLVAIGPLAAEMMSHNLENEMSSAHGKGSAWKYCLDHNAFIIGLGVDLDHHNTMLHVMEEAFDDWKWQDNEWYQNRIFDIIDENRNKKRVVVRERKPEWGTLYNAESIMYHDFYKYGIIERKYFDGVPVCFEKSTDLKRFLQQRNKNGYPYYKL